VRKVLSGVITVTKLLCIVGIEREMRGTVTLNGDSAQFIFAAILLQ
jgi:hypothetical protein